MLINILTIINLFNYIITGQSRITKYGARLKPTLGEVWPKPQYEHRCVYKLLNPSDFEFMITGKSCDILENAILRYTKIIKESLINSVDDTQDQIIESNFKIAVNLTRECEKYPHLKMDESYNILDGDYLSANSIWGILRALETYSQAITSTFNGMLKIPHVKVIDSPRFPHRGIMLDTSRHFIRLNIIFMILDCMSYNKLNVFHWHIVDDESFPYQSIEYPELSEKGAYKPSMIYSQKDIFKIIEYARMRGIRIIPEFGGPDHIKSLGKSHPELLISCKWLKNGLLGAMNPIQAETYDFLQNFYSEIIKVFADNYIHIGGRLHEDSCWDDLIEELSLNETSNSLYNFYINSAILLMIEQKGSPIIWFKSILDIYDLEAETVVQIYFNNWKETFNLLTKLKYRVLSSGCWVSNNWKSDYECDPHNFRGNNEQKKYVLGGESLIWTHFIGNHNILEKIFSKISATAERLWSNNLVTNLTDAAQRLEEHACRMILRGIPVESPSGFTLCT